MTVVKLVTKKPIILPNGLMFNTQGEVNAYKLGLEQARLNMDIATDMALNAVKYAVNMPVIHTKQKWWQKMNPFGNKTA